jgi:outer membrane murein-binding lipoprotein Lpp
MSELEHRCCAGVAAFLTVAVLSGCARQAAVENLTAEVVALRQELDQVKGQAQRAEDYVAISNLQRAYGYYTDKTLWDQAADLFSRDATLEIAGRGVFVGNDRVRQYLKILPGLAEGTVFIHLQLQPVINIAADGKTATGRWRALTHFGQVARRSQMGEGVYENAYVKEDGVWKISKLHYYPDYMVDTRDFWRKPGEALLGPFENLPPDRPQTEQYRMFPGVHVPPFSYANPVSGRR